MKNAAIKPEDERVSERARYLAAVAKAVAATKARYPRQVGRRSTLSGDAQKLR
jgi:hypothetical protein